MFNWKHVLMIAVGAGLPVLFQEIDGQPLLTLAAFGHDLASAGLVALAAAMKSFMPASAS
jgi:hypothetical protein